MLFAFCTRTHTVHIHLIFSGLKCILWCCHPQAPPLHTSPRPLRRLRPLFGFCGRMAENHWTWAIQRKLQHSRILQLRERLTHESRVSITLTLHTQLHILMSLKMTLAPSFTGIWPRWESHAVHIRGRSWAACRSLECITDKTRRFLSDLWRGKKTMHRVV